MKTMIEPKDVMGSQVCILETVPIADRYITEGIGASEGTISGVVHVHAPQGKDKVYGSKDPKTGKRKVIGWNRAAIVDTKYVFNKVPAEALAKIVAQQLATKLDIDEDVEDEYDVLEAITPKSGGGTRKSKAEIEAEANARLMDKLFTWTPERQMEFCTADEERKREMLAE